MADGSALKLGTGWSIEMTNETEVGAVLGTMHGLWKALGLPVGIATAV